MTSDQFSRSDLDLEVTRVLGYLSEKGYKYLGTSVSSTAALGEYLEAVFVNSRFHREVRVNYLPAISGYPDALKVFIEDGKSDSFAIDDFLRHQGAPSELVEKLGLNVYQGPSKERVASCLAAVKEVMSDRLETIVCGERWTHIPIDWGQHK
jgi:hypothetical protein